MATLTIENLPEELLLQLSRAAEQGNRSLNTQALYWLEQKASYWAACQEREAALRRMCQKYKETFT